MDHVALDDLEETEAICIDELHPTVQNSVVRYQSVVEQNGGCTEHLM